jgi:hypothetical protein
MKNAVFLAMAIVMCGCYSIADVDKEQNALMASWMGADANDLIASWGPPTNVMTDGQGGRILIYEWAVTRTAPSRATTQYNAYNNTAETTIMQGGTSTQTYTRMFWADRNNMLYRWSWKGREAPAWTRWLP